MSFYTRRAVFYSAMFGVGDFFAQFYAAHKDAAARRARGEKREGERPTSGQMLNMLDTQRLGENTAFGALAGLFLGQYELFLPRIFGTLSGNFTASICALGLQQLVVTPLLLLTYFNAMTGIRGGLADPSFMNAHSAGAYTRNDVWTVEKYITQDVMAYPLLMGWAVYAPFYILQYLGPLRGSTFILGGVTMPWCGLLSYSQGTDLL